MFLHSEISNNNLTYNNIELMNVNDDYISNELKICHFLPEEQISYSSYSVICENLYNDINSHVINNTTDKTVVLYRLLKQTKEFKFILLI